jgi:hypothetical protein
MIGEMEHKHTPQEEHRIREAALDETLAESFPASDAPSSVPNPDNHDAVDDGSGAGGQEDTSAKKPRRPAVK